MQRRVCWHTNDKTRRRVTIDQPVARPRETGSIILDWSHDARHRTDFSREPLRDFFGKIVSSETADFRACY
jgi:hypothetical protein